MKKIERWEMNLKKYKINLLCFIFLAEFFVCFMHFVDVFVFKLKGGEASTQFADESAGSCGNVHSLRYEATI